MRAVIPKDRNEIFLKFLCSSEWKPHHAGFPIIRQTVKAGRTNCGFLAGEYRESWFK
jgi:hypothetical protein